MLPWIFLLLSLGAWWIVLTTRSMTELLVALIAGIVLFLLGFFGLVSARVGHVTRTQGSREQALLLTTKVKSAAGAGQKRDVDRGGLVSTSEAGQGPGRGARGHDRHDDAGDAAGGGDGGDGGGGGGGGD